MKPLQQCKGFLYGLLFVTTPTKAEHDNDIDSTVLVLIAPAIK